MFAKYHTKNKGYIISFIFHDKLDGHTKVIVISDLFQGFFNANGVEYAIGYALDVIGYTSRSAKNYGCLISRVLLSKVTVWL